MKKHLKTIFALVMVLACGMPNTVNVKAATTKLSATNATVTVGNTVTIKLKNNKKTVKWSASNSNIQITSSNKKKAKIKGVTEGKSTLKAKVGSKTYKCKVTVKGNTNSTSASEASVSADLVDYEIYKTDKCVVGIFENNNKQAISLDVKLVYYDANGDMLDYSSEWNYCFGAGKECAFRFSLPYDSDYETVDFASYKVQMSVEKSYHTDMTDAISVESNNGSSSLMATFTNNGSQELDTINVCAVYYDANGNVMGASYDSYADCNAAGSSDTVSFSYPYDDNYDEIIPASYKIYVNHAYAYNF